LVFSILHRELINLIARMFHFHVYEQQLQFAMQASAPNIRHTYVSEYVCNQRNILTFNFAIGHVSIIKCFFIHYIVHTLTLS
jgi:hypothetical protein